MTDITIPTSALMDEPLKLIEENATLRKQVEELAGALQEARDRLGDDRDEVVKSVTVGTLDLSAINDSDDLDYVTRYDEFLARIDAALSSIRGEE